MKRIITSVVTIAAVAALAVGGTLAVWTDSETIDGGNITAATISLNITNSPLGLTTKPIVITNGYPGQLSNMAYVDVTNDSDVPVELYTWAVYDNAETSNKGLCSSNVSVAVDFRDGNLNAAPAFDAYSLHPVYGTSGDAAEPGDDPKKPFEDYEHLTLGGLIGQANEKHVTTLQPHETIRVRQSAMIAENANNNFQGAKCVWNEVFEIRTIAQND